MDVLALFGWRTCRETPFKNSFSSASLPTRRSRAAIRASYSASTSAAAVSLSSPPASNLATQILIRLRPIPWRLARACSDSPPRNSWTTWRLNSIECVRCLAMGFLLESPVQLADSHLPHLSTPRGALHEQGRYGAKALRARLSRLSYAELLREAREARDFFKARPGQLAQLAELVRREEAARVLRQRQAELGRRPRLQPGILAAARHYRDQGVSAGEAWDLLN